LHIIPIKSIEIYVYPEIQSDKQSILFGYNKLALIVPKDNFSFIEKRLVSKLIKVFKKHFSTNPFWGFKRNENCFVLKSME